MIQLVIEYRPYLLMSLSLIAGMIACLFIS
jgi:hypothetical protein